MLDDNYEPDEDNPREPDELETLFKELWKAAYDVDTIPNEVLKTMMNGSTE
jgi:hypothetical protein